MLTTNAAESSDKLRSLLRLVGDDLKRCSETLVVVGEPLQQRNALHQLQLNARLCTHTNTQQYQCCRGFETETGFLLHIRCVPHAV